jgi:hypothetical protein
VIRQDKNRSPIDDKDANAVRGFGRWLCVLVVALVVGLVLQSLTDSAVIGVATGGVLLLLVGLMYVGPFLAEAVERAKHRGSR